jgi:hypothetical protein
MRNNKSIQGNTLRPFLGEQRGAHALEGVQASTAQIVGHVDDSVSHGAWQTLPLRRGLTQISYHKTEQPKYKKKITKARSKRSE